MRTGPNPKNIAQNPNRKPVAGSHLFSTPLHHGRVLFLEALVQALRALQVLVDAAHHAAFLAVDEGLGCEVVDAVVEAALDELGVHLHDKMVSDGGWRKCGVDRGWFVDGFVGTTGQGDLSFRDAPFVS